MVVQWAQSAHNPGQCINSWWWSVQSINIKSVSACAAKNLRRTRSSLIHFACNGVAPPLLVTLHSREATPMQAKSPCHVVPSSNIALCSPVEEILSGTNIITLVLIRWERWYIVYIWVGMPAIILELIWIRHVLITSTKIALWLTEKDI